jgi:hypothetical protein
VEVVEDRLLSGGGGAGGYRESVTISGCYTVSPLAAPCGALPASLQQLIQLQLVQEVQQPSAPNTGLQELMDQIQFFQQ